MWFIQVSDYVLGKGVCLGALHLPYLIHIGLDVVLGGGGKIGLGRVVFHSL